LVLGVLWVVVLSLVMGGVYVVAGLFGWELLPDVCASTEEQAPDERADKARKRDGDDVHGLPFLPLALRLDPHDGLSGRWLTSMGVSRPGGFAQGGYV
jgi:hypothetical protein